MIKNPRKLKGIQRVYAQTSFYQENLAFSFQLCTVPHFLGFILLPWFSCSLVFFPYSWIRFGGFFVLCMEKKVCGLKLFVCKNYISLTCLNGFFAIFNFDYIYIKSNISIWSLFQHANNSKKTKQLLGFQKPREKIRQNLNAWFSWKRLCKGWGRQQKTNEKPGRKPR